jgi:sugar phosphate isomerase/epimerase
MPKLAAFPKAWMQELCVDGSLGLERWFEMAAGLGVDGLEVYSGFLDLQDSSSWPRYRRLAEEHGLAVSMMCCSPDFTHPDPGHRRAQVEKEKGWIDMAAALGCRTCRVLSGQRRPELSREEGLGYATGCIEECLPHAAAVGITLVLENHYKDDFWEHPEFAQATDVFCELVGRIDSPHFGVNYDPSNAILAGEDPLDLLARVRHRVVSMHASDRYVAEGTLDDLRREEAAAGYARRLRHGEIGQGLNDYDAIFGALAEVGFDGWISIEDGVEGLEQLRRSVGFLRAKMRAHWKADTREGV